MTPFVWPSSVRCSAPVSASQIRTLLSRDPDASLLETDRGREYLIYRALEGSDVPAPRALWLEDSRE